MNNTTHSMTPASSGLRVVRDYRTRLICGLQVRLVFGDTTISQFGAVPHMGVIVTDLLGNCQIGWMVKAIWDAAPVVTIEQELNQGKAS